MIYVKLIKRITDVLNTYIQSSYIKDSSRVRFTYSDNMYLTPQNDWDAIQSIDIKFVDYDVNLLWYSQIAVDETPDDDFFVVKDGYCRGMKLAKVHVVPFFETLLPFRGWPRKKKIKNVFEFDEDLFEL